MSRLCGVGTRRCLNPPQLRFLGCSIGRCNPRCPVVTEPKRRQEVQFGWDPPPVGCCDPYEDVFWSGFGVLDEYVKVAVLIEDASVEQFIFKLVSGTAAVCLHQIGVW